MKTIAKGIIGVSMLAAFGLSHASGPIYYTIDGGATQQLHVTPITDTFVGPSTVSAGFCEIGCTLSATGTLTDDLNGVTALTVTNASVSGGLLCSAVQLSGFDWYGEVDHDSIPSPLEPVTFTLDNVSVYAPICGTCSSNIDVTFDPANGGSFEFDGPITPNGSCNVVGSLTSTKYYDAWH